MVKKNNEEIRKNNEDLKNEINEKVNTMNTVFEKVRNEELGEVI